MSEIEQKSVHQVYQQIAKHFNKTRHTPWPKVSAFLESLESGSLGCDVGCGNGKYFNVNPNVYLVGLDRCFELCQFAREKGFVLNADGLELPFCNERFDFAISIAVIHHFSTHERRLLAIKEILRVLKPNAKALIYVWAMEQDKRKFDDQDSLVPWKSKKKVYMRYYHLFKKGELDSLIETAGGCILDSGRDLENHYCLIKRH